MKYFITAFLLFFCLSGNLSAQNAWRKSKRSAETAERTGNFAEAAALYEASWKANNKKTKLIYQAGELYAILRDYQRAADCYKEVKEDKDFPFARLYYARALRQSGSYEKAISEYALFTSNYGGVDADKLRDYVQKEIRGCELGLQGGRTTTGSTVQVTRLGTAINSSEIEFAPIAFGEDLLYFSSTASGRAAIFRSQKQNGIWSKAVQPSGFPDFKEKSFCNGSFSPDNSRFYFTECSADKSLRANCQIYVMSRSGDRWSEPQKLPSSVNVPGYTSTHPSVASIKGKEFLFFSSNKPGGKGGMDIYSARIYPDKKEPTFGIPANLGVQINTDGNEVTPYFDASENTLYFSSNAHVGMGGLDIHKSKMLDKGEDYGKAENVGIPYNSPADDHYFVKLKGKNGGFLVSNRVFKDKASTTDDDVFEFAILQKNLVVKGKVTDKCKGQVLADSRVNLFEVTPGGQKRLLNTKLSKDGSFAFGLLPDKKFVLEAEKQGFRSSSFEITAYRDSTDINQEKNIELDCNLQLKESTGTQATAKSDSKNPTPVEKVDPLVAASVVPAIKGQATQKAVAVEKKEAPVSDKASPKTNVAAVPPSAEKPTKKVAQPPVVRAEKKETPVNKAPETKTTTADPVAPATDLAEKTALLMAPIKGLTSVGTMSLYEIWSRQKEHLITSAPKHSGAYFKIQIIALKRFDFEEKRYDSIRGLGRADMEYIVIKDMVRVLLADYFKREDAEKLLPEIRKNREFSGAFIVQYIDGVRY